MSSSCASLAATHTFFSLFFVALRDADEAGPSAPGEAEEEGAGAADPPAGTGKRKRKATARTKPKKAKPAAHAGVAGNIYGKETIRTILSFPLPKSDRWTDEVTFNP